MCIACEIGYWNMVDALEAERSASKAKAPCADDASGFTCKAPERKSRSRAQKATDERAP